MGATRERHHRTPPPGAGWRRIATEVPPKAHGPAGRARLRVVLRERSGRAHAVRLAAAGRRPGHGDYRGGGNRHRRRSPATASRAGKARSGNGPGSGQAATAPATAIATATATGRRVVVFNALLSLRCRAQSVRPERPCPRTRRRHAERRWRGRWRPGCGKQEELRCGCRQSEFGQGSLWITKAKQSKAKQCKRNETKRDQSSGVESSGIHTKPHSGSTDLGSQRKVSVARTREPRGRNRNEVI
mmetsp:Transcript_20279/g.56395  ORF Transcript_20279/g.56395 Transcript_20279/m.56395 type:complete len:244 (+) Transcript_20279:669-1400(+)